MDNLSSNLMKPRVKPGALLLKFLVLVSAVLTFGVLIFIIGYILIRGIPHLSPELFALKYTTDNVSMFPAIVNTLIMTACSLVVAVPLGIFTAIYLVEYAGRGNKLVKIVPADSGNPIRYSFHCLRLIWYAVFCNLPGFWLFHFSGSVYIGGL